MNLNVRTGQIFAHMTLFFRIWFDVRNITEGKKSRFGITIWNISRKNSSRNSQPIMTTTWRHNFWFILTYSGRPFLVQTGLNRYYRILLPLTWCLLNTISAFYFGSIWPSILVLVPMISRCGQLPSWRSWLARQSHNLKVVSSSLTEGILSFLFFVCLM